MAKVMCLDLKNVMQKYLQSPKRSRSSSQGSMKFHLQNRSQPPVQSKPVIVRQIKYEIPIMFNKNVRIKQNILFKN